jgi:hypothetical protein
MVSSGSLGLLCPSSSSSLSSNTDLSYLETSPSFSFALSGAELCLLVTGTWRGFTYCANIPEAIYILTYVGIRSEDLARLTTPKSSTTEPGASEITARHDLAPCFFVDFPWLHWTAFLEREASAPEHLEMPRLESPPLAVSPHLAPAGRRIIALWRGDAPMIDLHGSLYHVGGVP